MSLVSLHCFHIQSKCIVLCDYIESWRFSRNCRQHCACAGRGGGTWILPSDSLQQPVLGSWLTTGRDRWYRACCTLWTQSRLWWASDIECCWICIGHVIYVGGFFGVCGQCQESICKWTIKAFFQVTVCYQSLFSSSSSSFSPSSSSSSLFLSSCSSSSYKSPH